MAQAVRWLDAEYQRDQDARGKDKRGDGRRRRALVFNCSAEKVWHTHTKTKILAYYGSNPRPTRLAAPYGRAVMLVFGGRRMCPSCCGTWWSCPWPLCPCASTAWCCVPPAPCGPRSPPSAARQTSSPPPPLPKVRWAHQGHHCRARDQSRDRHGMSHSERWDVQRFKCLPLCSCLLKVWTCRGSCVSVSIWMAVPIRPLARRRALHPCPGSRASAGYGLRSRHITRWVALLTYLAYALPW
jgi:hypothetical protein